MDHVSTLLVSLARKTLALFRSNPDPKLSTTCKGSQKSRSSQEVKLLWGLFYAKTTTSDTSEWDGRSDN